MHRKNTPDRQSRYTGRMHSRVEKRPWGFFEEFTHNASSTVKIITVRHNEALSLQTHTLRSEFWRILSGTPKITVGHETQEAKSGDSFEIPKGLPHRIEAPHGEVQLLEISFGEFHDDDIVRLDDKYGRS